MVIGTDCIGKWTSNCDSQSSFPYYNLTTDIERYYHTITTITAPYLTLIFEDYKIRPSMVKILVYYFQTDSPNGPNQNI